MTDSINVAEINIIKSAAISFFPMITHGLVVLELNHQLAYAVFIVIMLYSILVLIDVIYAFTSRIFVNIFCVITSSFLCIILSYICFYLVTNYSTNLFSIKQFYSTLFISAHCLLILLYIKLKNLYFTQTLNSKMSVTVSALTVYFIYICIAGTNQYSCVAMLNGYDLSCGVYFLFSCIGVRIYTIFYRKKYNLTKFQIFRLGICAISGFIMYLHWLCSVKQLEQKK